MVKTVELSENVPGVTAQALFNLVYGDDATFLRTFHKQMNNDPDAQVGPWQGDERSISFTTPVDAPAIIKRLVGKDVMRVTEQQQRSQGPDGSPQLLSVPEPDMPGGAKFATKACWTFSDAPGGGCTMRCVVACSASGPYGLAGTIEAFMAEAARKSLQDFLDFTAAYMARLLQAAVPAVSPATPVAIAAAPAAPVPVAVAAGISAGEAEQFFDAQELPLPPITVPSSAATAQQDMVLLYLRYQCRTGDQIVELLQAVELQVRSLQEKVAALQAAAEERQRNRRWLPELPETISTRQALLGAGLIAAASAAAALAYGSRRQQLASSAG